MRRGKARLLWTIGLLLLSGRAAAQGAPPPDGNKELAREWANKAKERFDAGDYQGAIDGIREASKHARPPTFTRLSAQAHEKLGKLVEAHRLYRSIVDTPLAKDAPDAWVNAQAAAKKELDALTPRIPTLEIAVSGAAASDLEVRLDGAPFDAAQLGRPVPQDPGAHTIVVRAPDRPPVTREVVLREGASERADIRLAALKGTSSAGPGPRAPGHPSSFSVPPALPFVAFGVGGAGLVAGAITGGLVLGGTARLKAESCVPAEHRELVPGVGYVDKCTEGSRAGIESLRLLADISTASFVVAGVGVAAGVVLLLLPGKKKGPSVGVAVSPSSLSLRGEF
jgi:hypothetical protein